MLQTYKKILLHTINYSTNVHLCCLYQSISFVSYNDIMQNIPEAFVFTRIIGTWVIKQESVRFAALMHLYL